MTALTWGQLNRSGRYERNLREIHKKAAVGAGLLTVDGDSFVFDDIEFRVSGRDAVSITVASLSEDAFVAAAMRQAPEFLRSCAITFKRGSQSISSGRILKDVEFGGRPPAGAQLTARWGRLAMLTELYDTSYQLNMPSSQEMGEFHFINDMNTAIHDAIEAEIANPNSRIDKSCPSITIRIGSHTFNHIVGVNKVSGTPKADLALVECHNGSLTNVGFISHKMGSRARDFGQWSGLTTASAGRVIGDHPEVTSFVNAVRDFTVRTPGWARTSGFAMAREIVDERLKMYSLYGPNYGAAQFGEENIHVLMQGDPVLRKRNGNYTMTATHVHNNGDSMNGDFIPALMAIKKGSWENIINTSARGVRSDFNIRGMRFSIYPQGGRNVTHTI